MEIEERNYITENLCDLLSNTRCSQHFLSYFQSVGVFSPDDVESVNKTPESSAQAKTFYDLIVQKINGFSSLIRGLDKTCQSGAKAILVKYNTDKLLPNASPPSPHRVVTEIKPFKYNCRAPAPLFTGRTHELTDIHNILTSQISSNASRKLHMVAVCGLGGIGKTEFVRQYIQTRYLNFYSHVMWINAEPEMIKESFRSLAKDILSITTKDANQGEKDIKVITGQVYQMFTDKTCLFVFDNAEKGAYLRDYLPFDYIDNIDIRTKIHVVFTSRDKEWSPDEADIIFMRELDKTDAVEFARKGLEITSTEDIDDVSKLVEILQNFPLAIQQAIAYIKEERHNDGDDYTIMTFLDEYKTRAKEVLTFSPSSVLHCDYNETTYTTWRMTLDKIAGNGNYGGLAVDILNFMAYMSDSFHRGLFGSLAANQRDVGRAIRLLLKYSMINGDMKQDSKLRIHRLVQEVIRLSLQIEKQEETTIESTLVLLSHHGHVLGDSVSHALTVWEYAKPYIKLRVNFSKFPTSVVTALVSQDRYKQAIEFGKDNFKMLSVTIGEKNIDTLELKHQIGVAKFRMGDYTKAMATFEEVLNVRKQVCGEKNPSTLDTIHFIASLKLQLGYFEEAREMFRDVFQKKVEVLGLENEKTIDSLHNEGICLLEMSNYSEALECYKKSYDLYSKVLGSESDAALTTLQNMAVLNGDMGLVKVAVKSFRELQHSSSLQNDTRRKLTIEQNLAFYLMLEGSIEDAYELSRATVEKLALNDGEDHPETLTAKSNLGIILRKLGRINEALSLQNEVYTKCASRFGQERDKTLMVKAELALLWACQGFIDESISALEEIIKVIEARRGSKNHNVIRLKLEYAGVLEKHENYSEALRLFQQVKKVIEESLTADHIELPKINERIISVQQSIRPN